MEFNYKLLCILFVLFIFICYTTYPTNRGYIEKYKLLVHDWGAQIVIDNINTFINTGDVFNKEFKWFSKYNSYTGIYHIDTGSHLLTDMISNLSRNDYKKTS